MIETFFKIPFYAKVALIFISVFALIYTLYIGQQIIIPILYATIVAILLNPVVNYLMQKKISKFISISIVVGFTIFVVLGILYLISSQLSMFSETFPQLKEKFSTTSTELVQWVSEKFKIRKSIINAWISETESEAINDFAIGEKLTEVGRLIMVGMLLPVYLFLILYYKSLLLEFIHRLFQSEHHIAVDEILTSTKKIVQSYLTGIFFEMIIIAVLNSVGLLLLGIEYAIILGVMWAVLNIIPYLGGLISTTLSMVVAFITTDSLTYPVLVFCLHMFVQFVDNNFIVPNIVSSRVQINALISLIAIIIGGALWGISGMFLSIPLTAIMKVIFDHIESLKPWGFLLGDLAPTVPKSRKKLSLLNTKIFKS